MIRYRRFLNTIENPPNPEQDLQRMSPGTLGTDPNNPMTATGVKLGLMLYHNSSAVGTRSCADCHSLPDGSSNTATLNFLVEKTITGGIAELHPFESGTLRNAPQREMVIHDDFTDVVAQFTANHGLLHPGTPSFLQSFSINTFVHSNFVHDMPGPNVAQQLQALTRFVRQLDSGTAPLAGFGYTVDPEQIPLDSGTNKLVFDFLESQVKEANIGLAVYTRDGGQVKGYWYDITSGTPGYREEGTSNPLLTRAALLALSIGTDDVVIAQGTPLGGERRWASTDGSASPITDLANPPGKNVRLLPMAPNTAYVDVTKFNGNLGLNQPPDTSIWTLRTLQEAVVGHFGVPALRHEPPRRFRVTGTNIRPGAKLFFAMMSLDRGPALAAGSRRSAWSVAKKMEMDLYPTRYTSQGRIVWETRVELDSIQTFALLNGGYWAPSVADVLHRRTSSPELEPLAYNRFLVGIENEDGTSRYSPVWQVLEIQDAR
jgi:hypothetical protein